MNLIANTGIHYCVVPLDIKQKDEVKMYFHEWEEVGQLKLEIAHCFSDNGVWVKKHDLSELGYIKDGIIEARYKAWEDVREDFEENGKTIIADSSDESRDLGCFSVYLGKINGSKFKNVWIPMPFFLLGDNKKSEFGPTNWCRGKLVPVEPNVDPNSVVGKYDLLLAFDTRSLFEREGFDGEERSETPVFIENNVTSKDYALCNNEYKLVNYCSDAFDCEWVDKYLLRHFHDLENIKNYKETHQKLNYLAQYIFLMRYIQRLNVVPTITLFSDNNVSRGDVDLVVDIGNSRTCAVLFDEGDFEKSSPLLLQDFSVPVFNHELNKYHDSFDMRLAFREADFGGNLGLDSQQFIYPSMVRLGKEANRLIYKAINTNGEQKKEKKCTFSSPKRFLWDSKPQKQEWEFVQLEGEAEAKPIFIKGISEQLNSDGSLNMAGDGSLMTEYSRRALMTFAFLEILAQAKMQVNSFEQRLRWNSDNTPLHKPREISRIIVTCPIAMSREEQVSLRRCAEDAAIMLDRFFKNTYNDEINENHARGTVLVLPSAKKLAAVGEERTEWIYDEATAAQFVFLYAEIGKRYLSNTKDYFDLYGKVRKDNRLGDYSQKSLTIGSVDIGAGTTDVMIAAYKRGDGDVAGHCILTPVPLFWESFYTAGDDLLKELIQQLVIEGGHSPIAKKIIENGQNPIELMMGFLGTDNGVAFINRKKRADFNLQVSVPIIFHFLELLRRGKESQELSFNDIFGDNRPTQVVLDHFRQHFGFNLEDIQWRYDDNTARIVEQKLEPLIGKIAALFSYYACDIVLLSGRPTSLKPVRDLFTRYYAVDPNRIKSMNDYRVGRWYPEDKEYPFIDENGRFTNPKSIITTGAMIGLKAKNGELSGFTLKLEELINKLCPTTNYFGRFDQQRKVVETIITPDQNKGKIDIWSLDKPIRIGARQVNVDAYPSRPFYTLCFNEYNIEDRAKGRVGEANENDKEIVKEAVKKIKAEFFQHKPLTVTIERDKDDMEKLFLDSVVDSEGSEIKERFFCLLIQSMSEIDNFWLDSGIFELNLGDDIARN